MHFEQNWRSFYDFNIHFQRSRPKYFSNWWFKAKLRKKVQFFFLNYGIVALKLRSAKLRESFYDMSSPTVAWLDVYVCKKRASFRPRYTGIGQFCFHPDANTTRIEIGINTSLFLNRWKSKTSVKYFFNVRIRAKIQIQYNR